MLWDTTLERPPPACSYRPGGRVAGKLDNWPDIEA